MPKKSAPPDLALIAKADRFDLTIFLGRGEYRTEHFDSLAAARDRAPAMVAEVANGRRAMIYAITPEGRSTLVPDDYAGAEAAEEIPAAFVAGLGKNAASAATKGHQRPPKAEAAPKPLGKRAAILAAAQAGQLPTPPDFNAPTHARFRAKLAAVVSLVEAGDVGGLKAFAINPVSSSPKAIARYRDLAVTALEARRAL